MLGLLNSSLYNYLAKGIINNTNSIQITGINALPFIAPDNETREKIEQCVNVIIERKKFVKNYSYIEEQKRIDIIIFNFYKKRFQISESLKKKLEFEYSVYK